MRNFKQASQVPAQEMDSHFHIDASVYLTPTWHAGLLIPVGKLGCSSSKANGGKTACSKTNKDKKSRAVKHDMSYRGLAHVLSTKRKYKHFQTTRLCVGLHPQSGSFFVELESLLFGFGNLPVLKFPFSVRFGRGKNVDRDGVWHNHVIFLLICHPKFTKSSIPCVMS